MIKFLYLQCCLFVSITGILNAQTITLPMDVNGISGGNYANSQVKLEFTAGEPVAGLIQSDNFYINQGFQQGLFQNLISTTTQEWESAIITLFPNPTGGFFNIDNKSEHPLEKVAIYNAIGQFIQEKDLGRTIQLMDVSFLNDGFYWLDFTNVTGQHQIIKLIKSGQH